MSSSAGELNNAHRDVLSVRQNFLTFAKSREHNGFDRCEDLVNCLFCTRAHAGISESPPGYEGEEL